MTTAAVKEKTQEAVAEARPNEPRMVKPLDASCIRLHHNGQCWAEHFVQLPAGVILDDLKEPGLFKTIQSRQRGAGRVLRVLDRVTLVDADASWLVEARVAAATVNGASISIIKKIDLPARTESLPMTEDYKVQYVGVGYAVVHKRTGAAVNGMSYESLQAATAVLYAQIPKHAL